MDVCTLKKLSNVFIALLGISIVLLVPRVFIGALFSALTMTMLIVGHVIYFRTSVRVVDRRSYPSYALMCRYIVDCYGILLSEIIMGVARLSWTNFGLSLVLVAVSYAFFISVSTRQVISNTGTHFSGTWGYMVNLMGLSLAMGILLFQLGH